MATHVPRRSAVEGLGSVVPALTVAAHEEDLVLDVAIVLAAVVEVVEPVLKPLPLGLLARGVEVLVSGVRPLDQTEVDSGLG